MNSRTKLRQQYHQETGKCWKQINVKADPELDYVKWLEDKIDHDVKSLPNEDIIDAAATHWVFDKHGNKFSNNNDSAGDNYGSFVAGVRWLKKHLA